MFTRPLVWYRYQWHHGSTQRRLGLWRLLSLLIGIYSGLLFQSHWTQAASAPLTAPVATVRMMSWNAYFLNRDAAAFLQEVNKVQPDLIAIQEYSDHLTPVIQGELRARYPYQELYPTGTPAGMAVISRYPILSATLPDFDPVHGCNCHVLTLDINGHPVTLINAHPWPPDFAFKWTGHWSDVLGLDTTPQDPIFAALLARIAEAKSPLLVVGDMNTMPFQPNIGRLQAVLTDTFEEAGQGMGFTFPLEGKDYDFPPVPFMRIDYIFHDTAWVATHFAVGTIPGSDHRYVTAELALPLPAN